MTEYSIKITPYAKRQIELIVDYISKELFNPQAAFIFAKKLRDSINILKFFPESNPLINTKKLKKNIRKKVIEKHLIYYEVSKLEKNVTIIAVISSSMNQLKQLQNAELE